jgi:hypothetical protein
MVVGFGRSKRSGGRGDGEGRSLEPILLDYFTRDGSTLTMRLLATSPQIAVGGGYPYEHKYFAYLHRWAQMLDRTDWPPKLWNGSSLATLLQEERVALMGAPPWTPRELFAPAPGEESFSERMFQASWEEFSHRAARQTRDRLNRPDAEVRYYAEKHLTTWRVQLDRLPPLRVIALLRDPRDTFVSITAFSRMRVGSGRRQSMGRRQGESQEAWLDRHLGRQKERLQWIRQALEGGTMPVVRYEDLVLNLDREARRLEDVLGVELDPAAVRADEEMRSTHVSAGTPEASIGRWRREMSPGVAKRFNRELGEELEALGFDLAEPDSPVPTPAAATPGGEAQKATGA